MAFVDAAMLVEPDQTAGARANLAAAMGERAVVDAAAVAAMFQLNTRAADSAGIQVEAPSLDRRAQMAERLGFIARADGIAP